MATSLETCAIVVTRVHFNFSKFCQHLSYHDVYQQKRKHCIPLHISSHIWVLVLRLRMVEGGQAHDDRMPSPHTANSPIASRKHPYMILTPLNLTFI